MNKDIFNFAQSLQVEKLDALEISGNTLAEIDWREFRRLDYPEFDLINPVFPSKTYDVVICQQVLEHVKNPFKAMETLSRLLKPGGVLIVSTPFLLKIHAAPNDYWRFTIEGMHVLLTENNFAPIEIKSWGNKFAVRNNLNSWAKTRWYKPSKNEPDFPVVIWAFANRVT